MKRPLLEGRLATGCVLLLALLWTPAALAQAVSIDADEITALQTQLDAAAESRSSTRQKFALRRVIREGEGLIKQHADAGNRFEVLGVLFRAQQQMVELENTEANRRAMLDVARRLAEAPNQYAAIRLDADLLLNQAASVQAGGDLGARGAALRPLVDRYRDTEVEAKVVRIAMLMAIEFGDASLIGHLRRVIAERFPDDLEMINFQRDQLAGQVFGAPFVGQFKASDGKPYRLPMDALGKTTALYFWSKEGDGLEQLKLLAEGWQLTKDNPELDAQSRYQFISFNLDGLPDAGESILREIGLDWTALHLPGGVESDIYKTYVRNTPKLLTMTPTGYTAMVMSGSTRMRPDRTWERNFGSALARSWSRADYAKQVQSLLIGEFLVIEPSGPFDPTAPPEWKAARSPTDDPDARLPRSDASVPADLLQAIQACFIKPPARTGLTHEQLLANYKQAEKLCKQAIADHPDAEDLWIVRNRRIVALMGLWKTQGKREYYDAALAESLVALEQGMPPGTDVIARFCLARDALRAADVDAHDVIARFVQSKSNQPAPATRYALASLLALDIADRPLHEYYRRQSLDQYADHPAVWAATAFHLDRYHRYWMYHPPFTAGWTYGRRMGHFLAIGDPDDAQRTLKLELKTLDGEVFRIPEDLNGKWAMIEFSPTAEGNRHLQRYGTFIKDRPFDDVQIIYAVLDEDTDRVRDALQARNEQAIQRRQPPDTTPTLLVPGGVNNPALTQLGVLVQDKAINIAFIRPDGSIATTMSGLGGGRGEMPRNIVEWHDEQAVDQALARGDLEEAKRIAFAHAPVEQVRPDDAPRHWKPKPLTVPHLRSRAKVYRAMKQYDAALADIQTVYLEVKKKAGWLSMRTEDYEATEALRDAIKALAEPAELTR